MLMPKRSKYRRVHRGRMTGRAMRGNKVAYGDWGLATTEPAWITSNQIEAARIAMTRYTKRGGQGGGLALRGEDAGLLGVPGSEAVLRDEGLLFHPRLRSQRAGHIVEIPYLVPLVGGEGDGFRGRSRQWNQPRLCHQRRFQLRRQLLPAFPRPAQDTQAGGPAQIVFAGRSVLQNLR